MKNRRALPIILAVLALLAAAMLFVTYGTVLPGVPFASIQLDEPTIADSDGHTTVIVDDETRRALILNADNALTGVVDCGTMDSPFDAITDACVADGRVYLSGVSFAPDSEGIERERVAVYDKGGNLQGVVLEKPIAFSVTPAIKSLSNSDMGVAVAYELWPVWAFESTEGTESSASIADASSIAFELITGEETVELSKVEMGYSFAHDAAFTVGDPERYVILNGMGELYDPALTYDFELYSGYVFTSIDVDGEGILYACDDKSGSLCAIDPDSMRVRVIASDDDSYHNVHENSGVLSLCAVTASKVTLCNAEGDVLSVLTEVRPSPGFSLRMVLVWASGIYLVCLVVTLAVRKLVRLVRQGKTEGIGPMFLAVSVVAAVAIAIGNLTLASYRSSLEVRANEINMCADYLAFTVPQMSDHMEDIRDRDALREDGEGREGAFDALFGMLESVMPLVHSASDNGIGLYYNVYGKDDHGIFYLTGSNDEYVIGTSVQASDNDALAKAFEMEEFGRSGLLSGRTLRDETQYRLISIPSSDWSEIIGVIEIGSKMRSLESSLTGSLAQRVLALVVMVLVVYLAYSELRACVRCLFNYRQHQRVDANEAVALLTRPFTLAVTMLSSIDSVMTVLIARDLLARAGVDDSTPLLALPAVMLGVGMVLGQSIYGLAGSRVGLRRLVIAGALATLACASLTGLTVAYGDFWWYCAAKLAMSVPFGMLYTLGYSLPRVARSEEVRKGAAGGVKRTDTSAAALGTVLGGYAAQTLGNGWVYAIVAMACIPIIAMALNLLSKDLDPPEVMARREHVGGRVLDLLRSPATLPLVILVIVPTMVAAGYSSFLFPLFSSDRGLAKSDINNIVVVGQIIVYVCIVLIERVEGRFGRWRVMVSGLALLGAVFLLFSVNTTLAWSVAVIALVALLCKATEGSWKAMWMANAAGVGVSAGTATSAMFATRSLTRVAQPFILGALVGAADSVAVIAIGGLCVACAGLFFLVTRKTPLAGTHR